MCVLMKKACAGLSLPPGIQSVCVRLWSARADVYVCIRGGAFVGACLYMRVCVFT